MPTQLGSWTAKNIFHSDQGDVKPASFPVTVKSGEDLAPGQAIGIITASNLAVEYDPTATDGSQFCAGILGEYINCSATGLNRNYGPVNCYVGPAMYLTDKLIGIDTNALRHLGAIQLAGNKTQVACGRRPAPVVATPADADYTIPAGTEVVLAASAAAARVFTLPTLAAQGINNPIKISTLNSQTNAITVDGNGAETVNGAANFAFSVANQAAEFWPTATGWRVTS